MIKYLRICVRGVPSRGIPEGRERWGKEKNFPRKDDDVEQIFGPSEIMLFFGCFITSLWAWSDDGDVHGKKKVGLFTVDTISVLRWVFVLRDKFDFGIAVRKHVEFYSTTQHQTRILYDSSFYKVSH